MAEKIEQKQSDFSAITMPLSDSMTRIDAQKIQRAKEILAKCENCAGLPCQSSANGWIPVIEGMTKFGVDIRFTPCKFLREKNRQAKISRSFKMAKMPSRYIGKSFSDYEVNANNAQAVKVANELVKNPQFGLYIYGKPGTGKTFLAAIIAQELINKGKTVIFGDVPSVLDDLKDTFDGGGENKLSQLMSMLAETDMLVLDDLGTEIPTEWAVERLYKIINDRYNAEKPVVVTSNYKPNVVGERMNHPKKKEGNYDSVTGDRIISRLLQMCKGVMIKGEDRRY